MATIKSAAKPKRKTMMNFKVTDAEEKKIKEQAKKFANGNVSEWMRYSAMNLKPKKSDMVE